MNKRLIHAAIFTTLSVVCAFLLIGLLLQFQIVLLVFELFTAFFCIYFLMLAVDLMWNYFTIKYKRKKKIKDKQIKVRVEYKNNKDNQIFVKYFKTTLDLLTFTHYIKDIVKQCNGSIVSVTQLTTE